MQKSAHLYYHSPCFDGIVSCVLAWDFLETSQGWSIEEIHSVNYDMRPTWLSTGLQRPAAVVDFLYHPQAAFWADHHVTTFLTEEAKKDFERRKSPWLICDKRSGSCALLLWSHFANAFSYRKPHYEKLVEWADKIDSAQYTSVDEAVFGRHPALQINLSLSVKAGTAYYNDLVRLLRHEPLDQVLELPEVRARSEQSESMIRAGLERFADGSRLEQDGIVVFDVESSGVIISRYAPYYFFPQARYSAGIVRSAKGAEITAMRNPWCDFPSVRLGEIFSKFRGGGHRRVAALILTGNRVSEANFILNQIIREIREAEAQGHDTESEFL
jgi:hypothetical protein